MAPAKPSRTDTPVLEPTLDFMRLLWRIEHGLQSKSKQMAAAMGITGPQRLVLRIVDRFPGLSAGELAHIVRLHPSTITGVVQRLVDKKLLARGWDRTDRRRAQLRVRPDARRLARRLRGTVESAIASALRRLSPAYISHARVVLGTIADALEAGASARGEREAVRARRRARSRRLPSRT